MVRDRAGTLGLPVDARHVLILALFAPLVASLHGGRRETERLRWPLLMIAVYGAAVSLFFVTGRYRAPAVIAGLAACMALSYPLYLGEAAVAIEKALDLAPPAAGWRASAEKVLQIARRQAKAGKKGMS